MSNNYFRFKYFTVEQDLCAMKVGTDGTLLGAWAQGGERILDLGTGTGLLALMMAQRFPKALITAIDIDADSCGQAMANIDKSPFRNRIKVVCSKVQDFSIQDFNGGEMLNEIHPVKFDSIVCNPPFFVESLTCLDDKRTTARHTTSLSFDELFFNVRRLLTERGSFCAVIPSEIFSLFDSTARIHGFFLLKRCSVKTVPRKKPKRELVEYSLQYAGVTLAQEECLEDSLHNRSEWYGMLTRDFYIK